MSASQEQVDVTTELIEVECPDCEDGRVEVFRCRSRGPWQECCGGCTDVVDCTRCGGTGRIEVEV